MTTAQIAYAAGVAEGTLFRAFEDKEALIHATIQSAFDPKPSEQRLASIDRSLPLRAKLVAAVEILKARVEQVWQLMTMFNVAVPWKRTDIHSDTGIRDQLHAIFALHRDEVSVDPAYATRVIRTLTFGGSHPRISDNNPFTTNEIVSILLEGIGKHAVATS